MKVLIVDDEALARDRLRGLLQDIDRQLEVLEAENGPASLEIGARQDIDIVLLDIRMPGMDGLETAGHLLQLARPPAIIFCTAFDEHAIEAFKVNAVDYLLKPIRRERLTEALERAGFLQRARLAALREELGEKYSGRSHLSAGHGGRIDLIPVEEIAYLRADNKYVAVGWRGQETLVDESLKSLEAEFPQHFIRVHRNALVALASIDRLEKDDSGRVRLQLKGTQTSIDVSRRHLHGLKKAVRGLTSP